MIVNRKIIFLSVSFWGVLLILNSCIIEEFGMTEARLSNDWRMQVAAPVFYGNWTLNQLLLEKYSTIPYAGEEQVAVSFSDDSVKNIPSRILFEPTTVIDSFNFYIDGEDYLKSAQMIFEVENGCPLPFVLQLRFYNQKKLENSGATISPKPFTEAMVDQREIVSVSSRDTVVFSDNQLEIFKESDRAEFTAFFLKDGYSLIPDTLSANSNISFSIVLTGVLDREYD